MKGIKLGVVLMGIVLLITTACSMNMSGSIKDVYVEIVQHMEDDHLVELDDILENLVRFEYERREVDGLKAHVFTNESEVLSVVATENLITELLYEFAEETKGLALGYGKVEKNRIYPFIHIQRIRS